MRVRRRTVWSLVLGLVAAGLPTLAWAFVVVTELRDPQAFHDQGGMFITFFLFPLAVLAALACGIPAIVLGGAVPGGGGPGWRWAGVGLSVFGLMLAAGTCVGPQMLVAALR